jgi:hypothetical protein
MTMTFEEARSGILAALHAASGLLNDPVIAERSRNKAVDVSFSDLDAVTGQAGEPLWSRRLDTRHGRQEVAAIGVHRSGASRGSAQTGCERGV